MTRWSEGARASYGVVASGDKDAPAIDAAASSALRAGLRAERDAEPQPFFDRGPGYARLAAGARAAECDWL